MGTSLIRKRTPLGPFHRPMPRVLGGSLGVGRFLMGEVTLYVRPLPLSLGTPFELCGTLTSSNPCIVVY